MKNHFLGRSYLLVLGVLVFFVPISKSQTYQVGQVVENFTLVNRATNQPVSLYDLEGKVIFLEWFAWWCPFCQAAAAEIEPGIVEHYKNLGGTASGAPFMHVALNLQGGQDQQTEGFIDAYNLSFVLDDTNRAVASRFQSGGQPIFAIINGIANSPSHEQWELVYSQLGYGQLSFPIETFRAAVDSIEAAPQETGFEAYLSQLGIPEDQRGLADDPDRDGVSNALEYLTGSIANDPSSARAPTIRYMNSGGAFYLTIEYTRDASISDLALTPQFSSSLGFDDSLQTVEVSTETIADGLERVIIRSAINLGSQAQFARLMAGPASSS